MNVEQQVDALTASVENLKGAVVSKKATLDASVVDAQSATAQAQAAKANALSARDQAGAFKDAAYNVAQSAASAVAYQDLSAVALTKAVTAVDVFIYDTSKDSDGGAWRHRSAGTSWYREPLNMVTRGARREFPAVAVIVAEATKVTIYDGDDPSLPMWMVFEKGGTSGGIFTDGTSQPHTKITSITALNGKLVVGKGLAPANDAWGGITSWDLISERVVRATTRSVGYVGTAYIPFSERNTVTVGPSTFSEPNPRLINNIVNDVAMTVLPNAPIDPASGLPTPTIYAFTNGGISQIGWDGNENTSAVWDSVATASTYGGAKIGGGGVLTAYLNGTSLGAQSGLGAQFDVAGAHDRVMRVGNNFDAGSPSRADMALWRITTTVPTADQIRRIYDDEKALFQENAACTLYGASDVVTALANDPDTGLLHVGTLAGRSVFKGLRRVANTTVPIGATIAAVGGMVVEG